MIEMEWIAVDWGTTNLRCYGVSASGEVVAEADSGDGMASIAQANGDFEQALLSLIEPWLAVDKITPVIACGMVGAKQGWQEVGYQSVPCSPVTALTQVATKSALLEVWIHAGLKQEQPADVMRGEETQIAGFLKLNPGYSGVICLPGTHCKWVEISNGEIVAFRTFMTGEVFELLASHSILQYSVAREGMDRNAFRKGVEESLQSPASILNRLFSIRAEGLVGQSNDISSRSKLSGMMIGLEIASARDIWGLDSVAVIGSEKNTALYQDALSLINISVLESEANDVTLDGLREGYASLKSLPIWRH